VSVSNTNKQKIDISVQTDSHCLFEKMKQKLVLNMDSREDYGADYLERNKKVLTDIGCAAKVIGFLLNQSVFFRKFPFLVKMVSKRVFFN
jgi:hypothetical protein